jgi:hypothetical protein
MDRCTDGKVRTHNGRRERCIGGTWVPLPPPSTSTPSHPVETVIVGNAEELNSKAILEAIDSDESEVVVHILPKTSRVEDDDRN